MKLSLLSAITIGLLMIPNSFAAKDKASPAEQTIKHLQHAYSGEMNAHAHYLACAQRADDEGYHQVASLFRAAAESESIHAHNHAEVLRSMNVEPKFEPQKESIKSTKENVAESYKDEKDESTDMYPEYIKQAHKAGETKAAQTFTYAQTAEAQHAKYFKQAQTDLENWRMGTRTFLVCETCGYLTDEQSIKTCPACASEKFKKIN